MHRMKATDPINLAAGKAHNLERKTERILKHNRQSGYRDIALFAALYSSKTSSLNMPYKQRYKKHRMFYAKVSRIPRKPVSKGKAGVKCSCRFGANRRKK